MSGGKLDSEVFLIFISISVQSCFFLCSVTPIRVHINGKIQFHHCLLDLQTRSGLDRGRSNGTVGLDSLPSLRHLQSKDGFNGERPSIANLHEQGTGNISQIHITPTARPPYYLISVFLPYFQLDCTRYCLC